MDVHPLVLGRRIQTDAWGRTDWPFAVSDAPGEPVAEIVACDPAQSTIANRSSSGAALNEVVDSWSDQLLGRAALTNGGFPIRARWLGTSRPSPVWIAVAGVGDAPSPDVGKAWYIVRADAGARIYRGLKDDANVRELVDAGVNDTARVELLNPVPVRRGHCRYIPPGVPHAAGPGVTIAEVGPALLSNALVVSADDDPMVERVLEANRGAASAADFAAMEKRTHVTSLFTTVTRVMTTPPFKLERVGFIGEYEQDIPYAELVCWMVLDGRGVIQYDKGMSVPFAAGDFVILPAALRDARLRAETDCAWLEVTLPAASDLAGFPRPSADFLRANEGTAGHPIQINVRRRESGSKS